MTKTVFPKMKKLFIKYKRKPASEKQRELDISNEEIEAIANMLEISKREVRDYVLMMAELS